MTDVGGTSRRQTLADLVAKGLIKPETQLSASRKGETYGATVTQEGKVRLHDGYEGSPSGAATKCTGTSVNGWMFWHIGGEPIGRRRAELGK